MRSAHSESARVDGLARMPQSHISWVMLRMELFISSSERDPLSRMSRSRSE